jgi:hypothetical protein
VTDQFVWLAQCCRSGSGKLFLAASFLFFRVRLFFWKFFFVFSESAHERRGHIVLQIAPRGQGYPVAERGAVFLATQQGEVARAGVALG